MLARLSLSLERDGNNQTARQRSSPVSYCRIHLSFSTLRTLSWYFSRTTLIKYPCSPCICECYRKRRRVWIKRVDTFLRQSITRTDAVKTTIRGRTRRRRPRMSISFAGRWLMTLKVICWARLSGQLTISVILAFAPRHRPISRSNSFFFWMGQHGGAFCFCFPPAATWNIRFFFKMVGNSKWEVVNKSRNIQSIAARVLNTTVIWSLLVRRFFDSFPNVLLRPAVCLYVHCTINLPSSSCLLSLKCYWESK